MQNAGVRAGCGDGVVAQAVALEPGARGEGALDDALTPHLATDGRQDARDVGETQVGGGDGAAHLVDFVGVFDEPHFGENPSQFGIALDIVRRAVEAVNEVGDTRIGFPNDNRGNLRGECLRERVDVCGGEAEFTGHRGRRGSRAHPELSDGRVGIKLFVFSTRGFAKIHRARVC